MTVPGGSFSSGNGGGRGEQEEPRVVIRDKRRIDPTSGSLREPGGEQVLHDGPSGSAGPVGSPFPGATAPGDPTQAAQPLDVELTPSAELQEALQEAAERTADLQRVTAEYANYRKRVDRDREQVVTQAKASVVVELLPVLDDVDRAAAHGDVTGSFKSVADKLTGVLAKLGLSPVGQQGEPFDPAVHEAVQFETGGDVSVPTVSTVFRQGYRLGDRLVRPAVVVVTGPGDDGQGGAPDGAGAPSSGADGQDEPSA